MYTECILTAASILLFYKSMLCLCLYQKNHLKLSICSYFFFCWSCHWQYNQVPLGTDRVQIMHFSMVTIETTASNLPQSNKSQTSQILCVQPPETRGIVHLSRASAHFLGTRPPQAHGAHKGLYPRKNKVTGWQISGSERPYRKANGLCFREAQEALSKPLTHLV